MAKEEQLEDGNKTMRPSRIIERRKEWVSAFCLFRFPGLISLLVTQVEVIVCNEKDDRSGSPRNHRGQD